MKNGIVILTHNKPLPCKAERIDKEEFDGLAVLKDALNTLYGDGGEAGKMARGADATIAKLFINLSHAYDALYERDNKIAKLKDQILELEDLILQLNRRCDTLELITTEEP